MKPITTKDDYYHTASYLDKILEDIGDGGYFEYFSLYINWYDLGFKGVSL